jgi:hypothetical protein
MTTVTSPSTKKKSNIVIPSNHTESTLTTNKKEHASKDKPEFVVPTNVSESHAPLGVSVSKLNRNHILVSNETIICSDYRLFLFDNILNVVFIFLVFTTTLIDQRWSNR